MSKGRSPRVAIVLFSLGAPDRPEAVAPFLRNLFSDPAILRVPGWLRPGLARLIAWRRTAPATENYRRLGGGSPLLALTEAQGRALEAALPDLEARCFVAMRYWHPFAGETARAVAAWAPDEVVLLPLYPQFSTTTTASSLADWNRAAEEAGLSAPARALCCWADDPAFLDASAALVRDSRERARATLPAGTRLRVLFSAHGLPQSIVAAGDPYQAQILRYAAALARRLGEAGQDSAVCYQSRATPQKWLEPALGAELARAAREKVAVLVVPVSFVSEHSETLVELDIEYHEQAMRLGLPGYFRVPAQGTDPGFIAALAGLVRTLRAGPPEPLSSAGPGCAALDCAALAGCPLCKETP